MLPSTTANGDLPPGIHVAPWEEIEERFASSSEHRRRAFNTLLHIHELAERTGHLKRFLIFGSFVSSKFAPLDVDVALVMTAEFKLEDAPRESRTVFYHADADARFGASVFWVRDSVLREELMSEFLEVWQMKRDGTMRGIVEVKP